MQILRKTHLRLPHRRQLLSKNTLDDDFVVNDEVTLGRNRRFAALDKILDEDADLSEYVKLRLWLARQLALEKFDRVQG